MKVRQRAFGEAKALYTEALKITEYFMKVNPVEFNFVHAIVLTTLASVEEDMNDFENAQVHYDKAINIWTQLVQDNPDIYAIDMAQMLLTRAYMYYRLKDFEKTDHDYREAFNLLRGLQKAEPDETTRMLTISLNTYARLLYEIKEPEKAVPVFEECLYWAEKSDARIDADQRGAAYLYGDYAFIQLQHKQFMLAERSSRRGLELDSTQTWIYTNLALALLFQDRYDEALKIYRRWKDRPYPNPPLPTFREAFLKDFDDMENLGITHPDVAKVRELLKQ
jgi:tetratricopeptide (TPR) repeat protein